MFLKSEPLGLRKLYPLSRYDLLPGSVAFVMAIWTVVTFFPGYMSPDSVYQLAEARSRTFTLAHPPAMSMLWMLFDLVYPGPASMLALNAILHWFGFCLISISLVRNRVAQILALLLLGLWPTYSWMVSTIWKDSLMVSGTVFALGLLLLSARAGSRKMFWASIVTCALACSVRHNGFPVLLGFGAFAGIMAGTFLRVGVIKRVALCLSVSIAVLFLVKAFESSVAAPESSTLKNFLTRLATYDLVGASVVDQKVYLPSTICNGTDPALILSGLNTLYTPDCADYLFIPEFVLKSPWSITPELMNGDQGAVFKSWSEMLLTQPVAYLTHKFRVFAVHMGYSGLAGRVTYYYGVIPNDLGVEISSSRPDGLIRFMESISNSWIYRGWINSIILFVCFLLETLILKRRIALVTFLWGSSVLMQSVNFFIIPCADYRYNLWPMIATFLASFIVLLGIIETVLQKTARSTFEKRSES